VIALLFSANNSVFKGRLANDIWSFTRVDFRYVPVALTHSPGVLCLGERHFANRPAQALIPRFRLINRTSGSEWDLYFSAYRRRLCLFLPGSEVQRRGGRFAVSCFSQAKGRREVRLRPFSPSPSVLTPGRRRSVIKDDEIAAGLGRKLRFWNS
jgi:hypothetical protein